MTPPRHSTAISVSRTGWIALGAALVAPWLVVLWIGIRPAASAPVVHTQPTAPSPAKPDAPTSISGPWGDLEFVRITIEPPEDCIPLKDTAPDAIRWFFRGYTDARLMALWQSAGLNQAQQQSLSSTRQRDAATGTILLRPDMQLVAELSPTARTIIYAALAEFPENPSQHTPFRIRAESAGDWFENCGLPEDIRTLAQRLVYERNEMAYFSDEDVVLPHLKTDRERIRFLKTLSRKSTLLVQLRVSPNTDVEALSRYWGRGRRSKDILPLLDSLAHRPGGASVDLAHLLPRFARSLLYSFPMPSDNPDTVTHDCHWSALNFFKEQPDERFSNIDFVKETLLKDYYPAAGEPDFGDIVVLVQPDGVVVHSCVYLAAGVVFTKNGASFSVPWMLGELDRVVKFYSVGPPLSVRRYRSKN